MCPECGLDFPWGDVLNAQRRLVPGFVEHTKGFWKTYVAAWRTWVWAIWPGFFWRKIGIHHHVRLNRALLWVLLLLAPLHILFASFLMLDASWMLLNGVQLDSAYYLELAKRVGEQFGWPAIDGWHSYWASLAYRRHEGLDLLAPILGTCVMWPMLLMCLPFTRRAARVHWRHVWRAATYTLWWCVPIWFVRAMMIAGEGVLHVRSYGLVGTSSSKLDDSIFHALQLLYPIVNSRGVVGAVLQIVLMGWTWVWWFYALRTFRLARWGLVWMVLGFTAILGGVVCAIALDTLETAGWI